MSIGSGIGKPKSLFLIMLAANLIEIATKEKDNVATRRAMYGALHKIEAVATSPEANWLRISKNPFIMYGATIEEAKNTAANIA